MFISLFLIFIIYFKKYIKMFLTLLWAFLVTQTVKNLSAMQETWVRSLDRGRFPKEGNGNLTPVFLPGESHGQRNLRDDSPLGHSIGHDWASNTFTSYFHSVTIYYLSSFIWQLIKCNCVTTNKVNGNILKHFLRISFIHTFTHSFSIFRPLTWLSWSPYSDYLSLT